MREGKCFIYKEKDNFAYNCPRKKKVATILEDINKNSMSKKKLAPSKVGKSSLFIFLSFMSEDLFCRSFFTIQYILGNKINTIILIDIYTTRYGFINKKFAKIFCRTLEIEPQQLIKPKPL